MTKKIYYSKLFLKHFQLRIKPNRNLLSKFVSRVDLFLKNKSDPSLKDHHLTGDMHGKRSFSLTGDFRIIYEEINDGYIFLDIGTHSQVYRM